jgi:hypothetical protein
VVELILHLGEPAGLLLDPLEAIVVQDQALGRGARLLLRSAGLLQRVIEFDQAISRTGIMGTPAASSKHSGIGTPISIRISR